ncbi:MAG: hydroxyacid dehydrogenase [Actinobacteria bacterium]|nr:MAG: hydroxyacid dehydrogenase [Actinomycetota bacterium]
MRILVVGDSFVSADVFRRGLNALADEHELTFLQLDESRTPPALSIREYAGDPREIIEWIVGVEVLVVHGAPVTDEVLDASDMLRLVCCARGGPVNVDVAAASERSIPVVTTPAKNADAVADQTLAFMVMLARRFPHAQRFLLEGNGVGDSAFQGARFFGHDLGGHVLGLVGYGNVGHRVARRARAFEMKVIVFDPYLDLEGDENVEQVADLETLLERAHFVSLHARATPENENLLGHSAFARMRLGSYFVNTARETLVDEEALDEALSSGRLAGAALDVVRPRNASGPHPLLRHENVVLTPHIGGATHETLLRGATMVAEEIKRFAAGEPLLNVINRQAVDA